MYKRILCPVIIVGLLIGLVAITGCTPPQLKPDLVPANPEGWAGFCDIDDNGNLVVHVKNQGNAPAGSSYVKVDFGPQLGFFVKPVPVLSVGETATVLFPIPRGCFTPDCGFTITVDAHNDIDESNEENNTVMGNCLG